MSSTFDQLLPAKITIVRLYWTAAVCFPICDACAAAADLDRNAAPMVPVFLCSRCQSVNLARRLPVGWRIEHDHTQGEPNV